MGLCAAFGKILKITFKTKSDRVKRLDLNIQMFLSFCLKKKRFVILGQIIFLTVFALALKTGRITQQREGVLARLRVSSAAERGPALRGTRAPVCSEAPAERPRDAPAGPAMLLDPGALDCIHPCLHLS